MEEATCEICGEDLESVWEETYDMMSTATTHVYMGKRCENPDCSDYMVQRMA